MVRNKFLLSSFVYRIMSGDSLIGAWLLRNRHSDDFAPIGDLEDDATSSFHVYFPVWKSRTWMQIVGDALWIASAAFVLYMGDRSSNFFSLLWGDDRIRRIPLYFGALCAIWIVGIVSYTAFWTWYMRKINNNWDAFPSFLAPAVALLGLISFALLAVALWPVWSFLSMPLLFTLFMASMVTTPHLTFWFFTVDHMSSPESGLRKD